jgi:hypothetical protein
MVGALEGSGGHAGQGGMHRLLSHLSLINQSYTVTDILVNGRLNSLMSLGPY